jgi:uncharacterized protein (DUF362 family)
MTPCHRGIQRREFLHRAGSLSLTAAAAGHGWLPNLALADQIKIPDAADVGIARGSNMAEAVKLAVELSGGLDFIKPDQTVLIKPNVTGRANNPTTTHPEVLYGVIKVVADRGPKRILVSDRCFSAKFTVDAPKTIDVMKGVGHLEAVDQAISDFKAPVVAVGLEDAAPEFEILGKPRDTNHWRRVNHPLAKHWPNGFEQAELLFSVDHVINVPVIKTHFQAWFTMAMKAFVGMSHHRTRREFHSTYQGTGSLMDQKRTKSSRRRGTRTFQDEVEEAAPFVNRLAELNLGLTPSLNILDGTSSFVFGGPSHGDTADPKVIVAAKDRIAADATGIAVLKRFGTEDRLQKHSIWENPFIKHGIKIGLGVDTPEKINLKHKNMDDDIDKIREMLV